MMIRVNQLLKQYGGRTVLDVPSWHVAPGEIVGLVGSNGAGKTTFLRLVLDLIQPDNGSVLIDGYDVSESDDWKSFTGSYLDDRYLIGFLTAEEFLDFIRTVYGLSRAEAETSLVAYRSFLPENGSARYLQELSTGNAKKVGITAALFFEPRLVILDEPFANLDPPSQIRLKLLLRQMHQRTGTTMLISSHDLGHVTELCSRITLIDHGKIVSDAATTPGSLKELEQYFSY
jgi:ABC-2 type transport system ATP-binding protein